MNVSTMLSKDDNQSTVSYKDMILNKMNQKVSVIQSILNKKREEAKTVTARTMPNERTAEQRPTDRETEKQTEKTDFRDLSNRPSTSQKQENKNS